MTAPGRVAFAYDRLYPESVGGAERYYWALTRELARDRPVTYLTPRCWDGPAVIERDGVEIVALDAPGGYRGALALHLARHAGRYELVHCCGFPPGSVYAAALGLRAARLRGRRTPLVGDWHEVLPRATWRRLRGRLGGEVRALLDRRGARAADAGIAFSALHLGRLRALAGPARPAMQAPEFLPEGTGAVPGAAEAPREPLVVFLARLVDEKHPELVPPVLAELRRRDPAWRAVVFGDGPHRPALEAAITAAGVGDAVELRGFADWDDVSATLLRARALLLPTEREGFGLVVLEAAAHGVPVVLAHAPDNAAVELVEHGRNGVVAATREPAALADAVLEAASEGAPGRALAWFEEATRTHALPRAAEAHDRLRAVLVGGRS